MESKVRFGPTARREREHVHWACKRLSARWASKTLSQRRYDERCIPKQARIKRLSHDSTRNLTSVRQLTRKANPSKPVEFEILPRRVNSQTWAVPPSSFVARGHNRVLDTLNSEEKVKHWNASMRPWRLLIDFKTANFLFIKARGSAGYITSPAEDSEYTAYQYSSFLISET